MEEVAGQVGMATTTKEDGHDGCVEEEGGGGQPEEFQPGEAEGEHDPGHCQ